MIFNVLLEKLEELAPPQYIYKDDNTGFQIGRNDKEIKKVCLATDITDDIINQAINEKADLLITHHPLIYTPLTKILSDDTTGRRIISLIRNDINYFSMHTNFDVIGMADYAADILGLLDRQVLEVTYRDSSGVEGFGRFGLLPEAMSLNQYAAHVKRLFNLSSVLVYGDGDKVIETAAISPGSSTGLLPHTLSAGVDVLISGDIKHNMALDVLAQGIQLIDAGHYGLEKIFVPFMKNYFETKIPELEVFTAFESNPFYVV